MYPWFKRSSKIEDKGAVAIEFVLVLPVLLLTFIGLFEISNYVFCHNKMNRTAQVVSNLATRGDATKPEMDAKLRVAVLVAQPFNFTSFGNVIVTSVHKPTAVLPAVVMWRDSYPGGTSASRINPTSLPGGLTLNAGQTIIFTEVFFTYSPLIPGYIFQSNETEIYALAAAVPRQGQMILLPP